MHFGQFFLHGADIKMGDYPNNHEKPQRLKTSGSTAGKVTLMLA